MHSGTAKSWTLACSLAHSPRSRPTARRRRTSAATAWRTRTVG